MSRSRKPTGTVHLAPVAQGGRSASSAGGPQPASSSSTGAEPRFSSTESLDVVGYPMHDSAEADASGPKVRALPEPMLPTPEEVAEHNLRHLHHRSWCRHCVAGGGTADQHRARGRTPEEADDPRRLRLPRGKGRGRPDRRPFIAIKGGPPPTGTRWVDPHAVQSKGVQHACSANVVAQDLVNAGHGGFIFKSDAEPALLALKKTAVAEARRQGHEINVQLEESPVEWLRGEGHLGGAERDSSSGSPSGRDARYEIRSGASAGGVGHPVRRTAAQLVPTCRR